MFMVQYMFNTFLSISFAHFYTSIIILDCLSVRHEPNKPKSLYYIITIVKHIPTWICILLELVVVSRQRQRIFLGDTSVLFLLLKTQKT